MPCTKCWVALEQECRQDREVEGEGSTSIPEPVRLQARPRAELSTNQCTRAANGIVSTRSGSARL